MAKRIMWVCVGCEGVCQVRVCGKWGCVESEGVWEVRVCGKWFDILSSFRILKRKGKKSFKRNLNAVEEWEGRKCLDFMSL